MLQPLHAVRIFLVRFITLKCVPSKRLIFRKGLKSVCSSHSERVKKCERSPPSERATSTASSASTFSLLPWDNNLTNWDNILDQAFQHQQPHLRKHQQPHILRQHTNPAFQHQQPHLRQNQQPHILGQHTNPGFCHPPTFHLKKRSERGDV